MGSNRNCGRCGLPGLNGGICPVFQKPMEWDEPGCPMFEQEITTCELCGQPVVPAGTAILYSAGNDYHSLCGGCSKKISTCVGCKKSTSCAFENDPRPDKYIIRTIRQGNAQIQTQVLNPNIIRDTCQNGCGCFSEEFGCSRQINWCANYLCKWVWEEEE